MTASRPPLRLRRLPTAEIGDRSVPVAVTLLSRLLGLALLSSGRAGEGLLIPRCRSVHTFGMRFRLDLVFLDPAGRRISVRRGVGAGRFVSERGAAAVLELPQRDAVAVQAEQGGDR